MFQGVSTLSLDAKGRLAVPAKHRESLAASGPARVVVTVNPMSTDACLWLYPEADWRHVVRQLTDLPAFDPQAQAMRRLMIGYASEHELDGQGRILISQEQRDFAGLGKRVALVGQGKLFEIWDEGVWQESQKRWLAKLGEEGGGLSEGLRGLVL